MDISNQRVAQLLEHHLKHGEGRWFKSIPVDQQRIVQLAEHRLQHSGGYVVRVPLR